MGTVLAGALYVSCSCAYYYNDSAWCVEEPHNPFSQGVHPSKLFLYLMGLSDERVSPQRTSVSMQVVAANNSGVCFVWSILRSGGGKQSANFEPLHRLKAHDRYILRCLISPDVRKLATTSCDKTVKIWNLDTYQCEQVLYGHNKWVWDAVFSVDAAYLVTASSDHTARLWDVEHGRDIRVYSGHTKAVVCCALNDNAIDATPQ
jgi:WD40 repeat protein